MTARGVRRIVAVVAAAACLVAPAAPVAARKPDDPTAPPPRSAGEPRRQPGPVDDIDDLTPLPGLLAPDSFGPGSSTSAPSPSERLPTQRLAPGAPGWSAEGTPAVDPTELAVARTAGERAASAIRTRIAAIADARIAAATDATGQAHSALVELSARYAADAEAVQTDATDLDQRQLEYRRRLDDYVGARDLMSRRVTAVHTAGPLAALETTLRTGDVLVAARQQVLRQAVIAEGRGEVDDRYLHALAARPAELGGELADLTARREHLEDLAVARDALIESTQLAEAELAEVSATVVDDVVFPVAGTSFDFADTYLSCRDGCRRRHQGVDIMAPADTPVLAVERGVLFDVGTSELGGVKLWLLGESGTSYYYAHLSGYDDVVSEGALVEAGTPLGGVGTTGNAASTPPHLHFEVHPDAGAAVNPTSLVSHAAELRRDGPDPLRRATTRG